LSDLFLLVYSVLQRVQVIVILNFNVDRLLFVLIDSEIFRLKHLASDLAILIDRQLRSKIRTGILISELVSDLTALLYRSIADSYDY